MIRKLFLVFSSAVTILLAAVIAVTVRSATPVTSLVKPTITPACTPTPAVRLPPTATPAVRSNISTTVGVVRGTEVLPPGQVIVPARITDRVPSLPSADKFSVTVRHVDCTYETFLLAGSDVDPFIANLPPGDAIAFSAPRPSLLGHQPLPQGTAVRGTPPAAVAPNLSTLPPTSPAMPTPTPRPSP